MSPPMQFTDLRAQYQALKPEIDAAIRARDDAEREAGLR